MEEGYQGGDIAIGGFIPSDTYNGKAWAVVHWVKSSSQVAFLQFMDDRLADIVTRSIVPIENFDSGWVKSNNITTDWISGVDVKAFLTNNLTKVKFHLFSVGCTNAPNNWQWFAVVQLHTRAFAFSPFDSIMKTAFTSYENGTWSDWQMPEVNPLVSASPVIVPNNVTEYDITNLTGLSDNSGAIAMNGDLAAQNVQITGVKVINSTTLRVYFSAPVNGAMRVNILYRRT